MRKTEQHGLVCGGCHRCQAQEWSRAGLTRWYWMSIRVFLHEEDCSQERWIQKAEEERKVTARTFENVKGRLLTIYQKRIIIHVRLSPQRPESCLWTISPAPQIKKKNLALTGYPYDVLTNSKSEYFIPGSSLPTCVGPLPHPHNTSLSRCCFLLHPIGSIVNKPVSTRTCLFRHEKSVSDALLCCCLSFCFYNNLQNDKCHFLLTNKKMVA